MKVITKKHYEIVIIGGGPAGLSAGLWSAELGLDALILESASELGGQLLWTYNSIKNHLGIEAENGREMQKVFLRQIETRLLTIKTDCQVTELNAQHKTVTLDDGLVISANAIIIATGIRRRELGLENEDKFINQGIIKSGKGEGKKVNGKSVCIVGGGDAALENALILSEFAKEVTIIHRRNEFRGRLEFIEKVEQHPKTKILTDTVVTKLIGNGSLEALELQTSNKRLIYPTDFLLLRLGVEPNTELFRNQINLDKNGYCLINANCETNIKNIFAIGDVANPVSPTISSAVGMGATALKYLLQKIKYYK